MMGLMTVNILSMFKLRLKQLIWLMSLHFKLCAGSSALEWPRWQHFVSLLHIFSSSGGPAPACLPWGRARSQKRASKSLELTLHDFCHFHWPRHIIRSAQIQRLERKTAPLAGRCCNLTCRRA